MPRRGGRGVLNSMNKLYNRYLIKNARGLRKAMTKEERKLWYTFLRYLPVKFVRQKVLGYYIADFYCSERKIALELDGSQHYEGRQEKSDIQRDEYLRSNGITVLRISNYDIAKNFKQVKAEILFYLGLE